MPRTRGENRGGKRTGAPGKTYGNRTDLNQKRPGGDIVQFPSTQYGRGAAQAASQAAVPPTGPRSAVPPLADPADTAAAPPQPGTAADLFAPTARPDEPLTAGMPFGPGPAPLTNPDQAAVDRLRLLYQQTGLPSLGRLLEAWED